MAAAARAAREFGVQIDEPRPGNVTGVVLAPSLTVVGEVEAHIADRDRVVTVDQRGQLRGGHQRHTDATVPHPVTSRTRFWTLREVGVVAADEVGVAPGEVVPELLAVAVGRR